VAYLEERVAEPQEACLHRTEQAIEMWCEERKITLYPDERPMTAVLSWGPDVDTEMAEHPVANPTDLLDHLLWLLGEELER
jgi:hypothetical protein